MRCPEAPVGRTCADVERGIASPGRRQRSEEGNAFGGLTLTIVGPSDGLPPSEAPGGIIIVRISWELHTAI